MADLIRLVWERDFKVANILITSIGILGGIISKLFLIRALLSWIVAPGTDNIIVNFVYSVTEPFVAPVRNLMLRYTKGNMMFDFSLVIAWMLMDYVVIPLLIRLVNYIFI